MKTTTQPKIRWLIARDVWEIAQWDSHPLIDQLDRSEQRKSTVVLVAEHKARVVGWVAYDIVAGRIEVLRIAVRPADRRKGVGTALLSRLRSTLFAGRPECWWDVDENDLGTQLFLRANGVRCVEVLESAACEGDVYRFVMGVEW